MGNATDKYELKQSKVFIPPAEEAVILPSENGLYARHAAKLRVGPSRIGVNLPAVPSRQSAQPRSFDSRRDRAGGVAFRAG
jgi:hypothetical protein